jgi:hypothetical protein
MKLKIFLFLFSFFAASTTQAYKVSRHSFTTDGSQADVQRAIDAAPDDGSATVPNPP